MPRLIPYKAEHLTRLVNRETVVKEEIELSVKKETWGPAFTAIEGDRILGCAGLILMWPGVASAWMNLTEDIFQYPLWVHRTVKRLLSDYQRIYGLHRIEAVVRMDNERNIKWMEALGFKSEGGVAHAYTTDKVDALRYEMVRS